MVGGICLFFHTLFSCCFCCIILLAVAGFHVCWRRCMHACGSYGEAVQAGAI
jgi:hypothetical protein